ncbi:MAG: TGS domain-containing protein [Actinobacteria bacterium]|nr:MAG: TGS domain-containing protein [Actinomycetota bacterium]
MPMPHRTQMQVIKRRLVGKDGSERMRELRAILAELPNYRSGPYAEIRKWVSAQVEETRIRSRVVHRDSIAVRREGAAQIALVGAPNSGKSSLLQALSNVQIKTGEYAFTTTRPVPALTRIRGVLVQLVEIPGLIQGASEGRGGGRALLGVLRDADAIVLCHDASAPLDELETIRRELDASGIALPAILAATKADEAPPGAIAHLAAALPDLELVVVSILDEASLEAFREAVWRLTGLLRVFLRDDQPVALHPPATVVDVARTIHHDLAESCRGARVWGPSARFEGQRVGRDHVVADGDVVEILA